MLVKNYHCDLKIIYWGNFFELIIMLIKLFHLDFIILYAKILYWDFSLFKNS
jgi:hypothetical protein